MRETSAPIHVPTTILLGSFALDAPDRLHDLIRAARGGSPQAVREVVTGVRRAITAVLPGITDATVVPIPRHLPGSAHQLVVATGAEIAGARGWRVAELALQRTRTAPEGKAGGTRDPRTEARTLTWARSTPGSAIVLVDDVLRTGATFQACARAVRATGDERTLIAVALARAKLP